MNYSRQFYRDQNPTANEFLKNAVEIVRRPAPDENYASMEQRSNPCL
jgi:hypothetical protein